MVVKIPLTRGVEAVIDDDSYHLVSNYKWYAIVGRHDTLYAARGHGLLMHRVITNAPPNLFVDHKNGNGLDNTKANLRLVNRSQNQGNSRPRKGSSNFKGVSWDWTRNLWRVDICFNGKRRAIGRFKSELDAALAYDKAALEQWGDFALLNFGPIGVQITNK